MHREERMKNKKKLSNCINSSLLRCLLFRYVESQITPGSPCISFAAVHASNPASEKKSQPGAHSTSNYRHTQRKMAQYVVQCATKRKENSDCETILILKGDKRKTVSPAAATDSPACVHDADVPSPALISRIDFHVQASHEPAAEATARTQPRGWRRPASPAQAERL